MYGPYAFPCRLASVVFAAAVHDLVYDFGFRAAAALARPSPVAANFVAVVVVALVALVGAVVAAVDLLVAAGGVAPSRVGTVGGPLAKVMISVVGDVVSAASAVANEAVADVVVGVAAAVAPAAADTPAFESFPQSPY